VDAEEVEGAAGEVVGAAEEVEVEGAGEGEAAGGDAEGAGDEDEDEPAAKRLAKEVFLRGGPKKELAPGQVRGARGRRLRRLTCAQLFATEEDLPLLRSRLDALQTAWQLEHAVTPRWVSYAVWPLGSANVEVLLKRGKGWNAFGTHIGPRTVLCAEEALFLMESDRLVVYRDARDEVPISLHAGYASALAAGISAERYTAFAHLCRLGFVVHRHGTPWFVDSRSAEAAEVAEPASAAFDAPACEPPAAPLEPPAAPLEPPATPLEPPEPPAEPLEAAAPPHPSRAWWRSDHWPVPPPTCPPLEVEPPPSAAEASASAWTPELLYDVWPPQSVFTKKRVGKPFFRVCLSTARPPNAAETAALAARSGNVPVKCIIVKPGIVIGFDVGVVSLTHIPRKKGNR